MGCARGYAVWPGQTATRGGRSASPCAGDDVVCAKRPRRALERTDSPTALDIPGVVRGYHGAPLDQQSATPTLCPAVPTMGRQGDPGAPRTPPGNGEKATFRPFQLCGVASGGRARSVGTVFSAGRRGLFPARGGLFPPGVGTVPGGRYHRGGRCFLRLAEGCRRNTPSDRCASLLGGLLFASSPDSHPTNPTKPT